MPLQREEQQNDQTIQSLNFGGLNTTASRLNTPYSDASELLNVNIGINGSLLKRNGSCTLASGTGYGVGFRSVLGYNYSVIADNTTITVVTKDSNVLTTMRTFTNVYTNTTTPAPTQWVQLPDVYSRILALRADRPPVEVYAVELRSQASTVTTPSNTISFTDPKFVGDNQSATPATFSDVIYFTRNGVQTRYTGLSYTYNSGTGAITVTLPFTTAINDVISYDIVGFRWCWWAESIKWLGDRFYAALSRFNVVANDNNVEIPETFRSDLTIGEENLIAAFSSTSDSTGLYTTATQPTTATQYALTDGSVYVPGAGQYPNPAPYYITFGATRTPLPQPPESVKAIRFRELRFRQSKSIRADRCRVTVNDVVSTQDFTGTTSGTKRYSMYTSGITLVTSSTQEGTYLGFNASVPFGVGETDVVTMTNIELLYVGASALQVEFEESSFRTGSYRRAYGLGYFATYAGVGTFPSVGCVYQGRLALSGVITDKSRIIISSLDPAEERYSFFQITDDLNGEATDPFDVIVSGGDSADYIVGLTEWNNSLFALTRRSVYRISGGDQPLTAARRFVTYISNIGLVNPRAITRTDTAVYYLSDGGVFNLTPRVEDAEFNAIEKSIKIRDLFTSRPSSALEAASTMYFDSKLRRLYVTIPLAEDTGNQASDILVLDTARDAWTRYLTNGRFKVVSILEVVDNTTKDPGVMIASANGLVQLEHQSHYLDFTTRYTGSTSYTHNIQVGVGVPSVDGNQRYKIPDTLPYNSLRDINDIRVFVGTTASPTEVSFLKYPDWVYLDVPTTAGQTVWFVVRSPVNDSPQGLERYGPGNKYPYSLLLGNEIANPSSETLTFNTTNLTANLAVVFGSPTTTDVFHIGTHYLAGYVSGMFTQQMLGSFKRTVHAYLYFNNNTPDTYTINSTIEQYVHRVNANVAILYDSDDTDANTATDIYGYQDIVWDNAYFDTTESSYRQEPYSLFKEALIGIGYAYRISVFSYDEARWNLVGYQIAASSKGLRYMNAR